MKLHSHIEISASSPVVSECIWTEGTSISVPIILHHRLIDNSFPFSLEQKVLTRPGTKSWLSWDPQYFVKGLALNWGLGNSDECMNVI